MVMRGYTGRRGETGTGRGIKGGRKAERIGCGQEFRRLEGMGR
jgi:hypothetical protein